MHILPCQQQEDNWQIMICVGAEGFSFSLRLPFLLLHLLIFSLHL